MKKSKKVDVKKEDVSKTQGGKEISKVNMYLGAPDTIILESIAGKIVWHVPDFGELLCTDCICHCDCGNCACHCDCACPCNCDCDCCQELHGIRINEFYGKVRDVAKMLDVRFGEIKDILKTYKVEK